MQSDVTFAQDLTVTDQDTILHQISTGSSMTLEYRGARDFVPGTPIYNLVIRDEESEAHEPNPMASGSSSSSGYSNSAIGPSHRVLRTLSPVPEASNGHHDSSVRSQSSTSTMTRITGPEMSWESVCTQDMERQGYDIGDVAWAGQDLQWHFGQSRS
ncbi:hypothetical protein M422DRAFT_35066 [Sphaerobolus stellatus SS14]|uniref:Uncharacterized protein n=1 Tax=Sphaerobolus stellatus (strain SS14) TaxID=990650 RepID=A0A0C9UI79_SPHS4|nr:hypothetical protein M422DRAFT_35066 [Sphaerobolus stellatus SS14]